MKELTTILLIKDWWRRATTVVEIREGRVVVSLVKNLYRFLKGRHADPDFTYDKVEDIADEILKELDACNRA